MNTCTDINDAVKLDSLLRHVIPVVNNIPYELGVDLLRQSFTEFCRRTGALAVPQDLELQADVADYELVAPDGYSIYMVREVGYRGRWVTMPSVDYWYTLYGMRFSVVGNSRIILRDIPNYDGDSPIQVVTTVIPDECIDRIPREVSIPFGKYIADGAVAEALLLKNKPWYDPGLSAKKERSFNVGVNAGRNLVLNNRGGASQQVRAPRWI